MQTYRIRITMPDGSVSRHFGLYADGFEAVIQALTDFPGAMRIGVLRMTA